MNQASRAGIPRLLELYRPYEALISKIISRINTTAALRNQHIGQV